MKLLVMPPLQIQTHKMQVRRAKAKLATSAEGEAEADPRQPLQPRVETIMSPIRRRKRQTLIRLKVISADKGAIAEIEVALKNTPTIIKNRNRRSRMVLISR